MKRLILISLLALTGCTSMAQIEHNRCVSYGAKPGTDAYIACRSNADSTRRMAGAIISTAPIRRY